MTKLIIGLGNPGQQYKNTRHNIGFMVLDKFQKENEADFSNWKEDKKNQSLICTGKINNKTYILAQPQTFMNKSGEAVQKLMAYYKINLDDLLVIHDDIDIVLGEIKLQKGRSSAGHKGVQSIIDQIGSKDFSRLRIGIAKEDRKKMGDIVKFVLRKFGLFEKKKLNKILNKAIETILQF